MARLARDAQCVPSLTHLLWVPPPSLHAQPVVTLHISFLSLVQSGFPELPEEAPAAADPEVAGAAVSAGAGSAVGGGVGASAPAVEVAVGVVASPAGGV